MTTRLKKKFKGQVDAMHKLVSVVISLFAAAVCFTACSNIDCPLDNVVRMQVGIYSYETRSALTLTDQLSVTPAGRDTLLLNSATNISSFLLPLKEGGERDTLLLR